MSSNVCIICFIGIPGSGKTYFCNLVKSFIEGKNINIHVVNFDFEFELLPENKVWKDKRISIWNKVNVILENSAKNYDKKTFILLDDNMYYRSMRYEYVKLAKSFKTGYCQVLLDSNLELCIERNSKRDQQIPRYIIEQMNLKLEKPDKDKFLWEKYSIQVTPCYQTYDVCKQIEELLDLAMNDPQCYIEKVLMKSDLEEKNVIHLVDLALRSCVSIRMTLYLAQNPSKKEISDFGANIASQKRILLEKIKSQSLVLPKLENKHKDEIIDLLESYFLPLFT